MEEQKTPASVRRITGTALLATAELFYQAPSKKIYTKFSQKALANDIAQSLKHFGMDV